MPHRLKRKEFEKFNIFPGMGQRLSWTCSLIQTRIWPNLDSWSQRWSKSRWTSYHWKNIRQQRSSAGNRIQLNPTKIMKNRFHDTTNYVIFTFWVYNLHPVSYTMITKILSRKYKTILYLHITTIGTGKFLRSSTYFISSIKPKNDDWLSLVNWFFIRNFMYKMRKFWDNQFLSNEKNNL